ncbi:hypothetical protein FQN54_002052 [Arachnomyces sp. PD_36]|nr:hypothetical protein FQN54_002052 [Arachnomyces sp. PD_36]
MLYTPILLAAIALAPLPTAQGALQKESPKEYFARAGYKDCPDPCTITGPQPQNWTTFSNVDILLACKRKPKLFSLALHSPLELIYSCSSETNELVVEQETVLLSVDSTNTDNTVNAINANNTTNTTAVTDEARTVIQDHACAPDSALQATQEPYLGWSGAVSDKKGTRGQVLGATLTIQSELLRGEAACDTSETTLFAHYGNTAVGLYSGARLQNQGVATTLVRRFLKHVRENGVNDVMALQLCGGDDRNAEFVFGIVADTMDSGRAGLENVKQTVANWSNATCIDDFDKTAPLGNVTIAVTKSPGLTRNNDKMPLESSAVCKTTEVVSGEGCWAVADRCGISQAQLVKFNGGGKFCNNLQAHQIVCCSSGSLPSTGLPPNEDGTCSTIKVVSGDSCGTLASRCGITPAKFEQFNSDPSLCSTLAPGQPVCCSKGELPDLTPKPNPDGSCATYKTVDGDNCAKLAATNGLKVEDILKFNQDTWGFTGCSNLPSKATICLSKGTPPMPAPISNAVCGPQLPGTATPKDTSREALAKLNPCPLNVCCTIWGQCGTTDVFCTATGDSPGDVKPGTNGCISNCGTEIVNNDEGPETFRSIAYFEAFNGDRSCLYMDVTDIDTSQHTHLHFSFIDLTSSFGVSTKSVQAQFDKLLKIEGISRIAVFGGWTASTHPSTYYIFRDGVKPENRELLTDNLAAFINDNDLEGIDIDWEYPSAPDIPGIPPGDPLDGEYYRDTLALLRKKLPNKSISIATAASYWYLRGFPIAEIAEIVDYIVFMTYDLHGQWDYGSAWSQDGCAEGNCLRSHVNITETYNSLSMITKAGVPSHKIAVGVSSYGRSFRAVEAGCEGPMCKYVGAESKAAPGRCTSTAGYVSNAEINEIMVENKGARWYRDDDSESDILVYDDVEWVAFMNDENKLSRINGFQGLNFGGTADWAVDLRKFSAAEGGDDTEQPIEEGAWQALPCTVQAVTDVHMDTRKAWEQIKADQAWDDLVEAWNNRDPDEVYTDFSRFASDFFHGKRSMQCGTVVGRNNCVEEYTCNTFENVDGTGPAAMFILNSFVNINGWLVNNHDGVEAAASNIDEEAFSTSFAHQDREDEQFLEFMIINALTVGVTMGLAPIFNNVLKSTIKGTVRDNVKDSTYSIVSVAGTQTKEIIDRISTDSEADAYVQRAIHIAANGLKEAITSLAKGIFLGDKESLDFLHKTIADGKFFGNYTAQGADYLQERWETAMYGSLISQSWEMVGITPVVIDTEAGCEEVGVGVGDYLSSSLAEYAHGCVDGKRYYLVDPDGDPQWSGGDGIWHPSEYSEPNGLKTVADGDWVGVTVQDMISSAVKYYQKYGNRKAPEDHQDPTFTDTWDQFWDVVDNNHVVAAPGVIDVPVCTDKEASNNWLFHAGDDLPRYYSYPCNKVE